MRSVRVLVVAGPALVLVGLGLTHPQELGGGIGVGCFLVACAATALAVVVRVGRPALPGARQPRAQRIDPRLKAADWNIATFTREAVA